MMLVNAILLLDLLRFVVISSSDLHMLLRYIIIVNRCNFIALAIIGRSTLRRLSTQHILAVMILVAQRGARRGQTESFFDQQPVRDAPKIASRRKNFLGPVTTTTH